MAAVIRAEGVGAFNNGTVALDDVNLEIGTGLFGFRQLGSGLTCAIGWSTSCCCSSSRCAGSSAGARGSCRRWGWAGRLIRP